MEKLNIKHLREEDVVQARKEFEAARTTEEKHYARLALQRVLWSVGARAGEEVSSNPHGATGG